MVWMAPLAIGAAASLYAAWKNSQAQKQANENNLAIARENIAQQREFAQEGLSWKVADARRAGIHPLAALGAPTSSFSPISAGQIPETGEADMVRTLGDIGQNVSRAAMASQTQQEKQANALRIQYAEAQLDGQILDNQYKASLLHRMNTTAPGMPEATDANFIPGQGNSNGLVVDKPLERTVSMPDRPAQEAGWRPDVSFSRTDTGLTPMVPESLSESLEDDIIGKVMWRIRNQFVPNVTNGAYGKPSRQMLPKGYKDWRWDHSMQEWQPTKHGSWKGMPFLNLDRGR